MQSSANASMPAQLDAQGDRSVFHGNCWKLAGKAEESREIAQNVPIANISNRYCEGRKFSLSVPLWY